MAHKLRTILYPVTDRERSRDLFTKVLGVEPNFDTPYYVGWQLDDRDIGLVPNGKENGVNALTAYWEVPDIDAAIAELVALGATVVAPPRDVGGGKIVAVVEDYDGNFIGLT